MNSKKIIVALDCDNLKYAVNVVKTLKQEAFAFKIGYEFFFNFGLDGYNSIKKENIKIFLDLKLNDIPNTVKQGIAAISKLEPYFTTIHISGGDEMQKTAFLWKGKVKLLGVSILTSFNDEDLKDFLSEPKITEDKSIVTNDKLETNIDQNKISQLSNSIKLTSLAKRVSE